MILDSMEARYVGDDASAVTFDFACKARLAAADEAEQNWALQVEWRSVGTFAAAPPHLP